MEEIFAAIDNILSDTTMSKKALTRAKKTKDLAEKIGDDAWKVLSKLESSEASDRAFKLAIKETLDEAPRIFTREVEVAVNKNDEYAYPAFLSPLLDVGYDESLYKITPTGAGWGRGVQVVLAMDEIAGTIDDYAQAVEVAREELGVKEGRDPEKASKLWRTKFYKKSRYFTTINLRLSAATDKAPFWSLLNYGSKNVSMSSDIGGTPYPSRGGTRFVTHIEDELRKFFRSSFARYKEQNKLEREKINKDLEKLRSFMQELDTKISELAANFDLAKSIDVGIYESSDRVERASTVVREDIVEAQKPVGFVTSAVRSIGSFISRLFGRD